uniref:Uncharacterized protein n=1 Tax=viral metagenome TaxID=1070528 RepID=A0A6M3J2P1_9ZZZZ
MEGGEIMTPGFIDLIKRGSDLIKIGDYTIYGYKDAFIIQHRDGEGMEVSAEKLEKLIDEFFREEF